MQIRALEAYQAMAKTANSKVIFLPAPTQTMQSAFSPSNVRLDDNSNGEGSSTAAQQYDASQQDPFTQVIHSKVMESI